MKTRLVIVVAAVLALGLGLGLGLGFGLGGNSGTGSGATVGASQLASIRTACQQWLRDTAAEPGHAQWCAEMGQWMGTYMGRHGFGPQLMWGEPSDLRTACEHWFRTSPPAGAPSDASGWCDAMVSWMASHVGRWSGRGTWGGWMRYGPMGGFRTRATPTAARSSTTVAPGSGVGYGRSMDPGFMMGG